MDTLKTASVVLLLLAVLYGVYVVINKPTEPLPQLAAWQGENVPNLSIDLATPPAAGAAALPSSEGADLASSPAAPSWSMPASMPVDDVPMARSDQPLYRDAESAVTPPKLLSDAPAAMARPKAAELAEQQWPTDTATLTPVDSPLALDRGSARPEVPVAAATEAGAVTPWEPPPAADLAGQPPTPIDLGDNYAAPVAGASDGQLSAGSYSPFDSAIASASDKIQNEQWHDALWTLSLFYGSPDLTEEQRQLLLDWLDPLAARVIYSREHLIENAYAVQPGDTLESVAENYGVTWQLLANINGFRTTPDLASGSTLKVVRGPMRAEVDLGSNQLTIFVGKLYAGRFPIAAGQQPAPQPGEYRVQEKMPGRTYYAGDGQTIPPGAPTNPFGNVWINLGNEFSLHGSPTGGSSDRPRGCIGLDPRDANDLYGILSKGSSVTILR